MANNVKTIQLDIDEDNLEVIERLENATGSNTGEVIRDALGFYAWLEKQHSNGYSVVTYKNGRAKRELIVNFNNAS